jgi:redox-sensitive bicupin YhaK (pirin superfamily)
MCAPRYQDIPPEAVPEVAFPEGGSARVLAGEIEGASGPVGGVATDPLYLDVRLPPRRSTRLGVPEGHNGFVYVYDGSGDFGEGGEGKFVTTGSLGVLGPGDAIVARGGENGVRFILVAGRPLGEPIARYGPFVMSTREEILQAFEDFRSGRFG